MKKILEQAQEQAERERQIAEMDRAQRQEVADLKLRHGVERLLGRSIIGHWCRQSYPYYQVTRECTVYVVSGLRFAMLELDPGKSTLHVWGRWDEEEQRPWWSDELRTLSDLAEIAFDPSAKEGAA